MELVVRETVEQEANSHTSLSNHSSVPQSGTNTSNVPVTLSSMQEVSFFSVR